MVPRPVQAQSMLPEAVVVSRLELMFGVKVMYLSPRSGEIPEAVVLYIISMAPGSAEAEVEMVIEDTYLVAPALRKSLFQGLAAASRPDIPPDWKASATVALAEEANTRPSDT